MSAVTRRMRKSLATITNHTLTKFYAVSILKACRIQTPLSASVRCANLQYDGIKCQRCEHVSHVTSRNRQLWIRS